MDWESSHTVSSFDEDMGNVFQGIEDMGSHVSSMYDSCVSSLKLEDVSIARSVVMQDSTLTQLEIDVETMVIRTIALRQPVARDLRELIAAIKIAACFNRVGNLCKSIANRIPFLLSCGKTDLFEKTLGLAQLVHHQLHSVITSYTKRDCVLARDVWKQDVEIDDTFNAVLCSLVGAMSEDGGMVPFCSQMMFCAKNLERIGDQTTFIAEMVQYVVKGRFVLDNPTV